MMLVKPKQSKLALHWQVAIALVLAAGLGSVLESNDTLLGLNVVDALSLIGTLFLNALKMVIVPLVMTSIMMGISGIASDHAFKRLGLKTFSFYMVTGISALVVGLLLVNVIMPGGGDSTLLLEAIEKQDNSGFLDRVSGRSLADVADIFIRIVPQNIFQAAHENQLLGLIFFSMIFGFFMGKLKSTTERVGQTLSDVIEGIQAVMILITLWVIRFMPYGVFALVAKTLATTGFDIIIPLLKFFVTVTLALAIHFFITLPLILRLFARLSPKKYMGQVLPALLTAFSTASSSATLPVSLSSAQQNAGISKRISSFVLPLGATVNMDGTALYECVVVIFIAQLYGIELSFAMQLLIVVLALVTSIGVAGIPAASLVAITLILTAVGLPIEAMGLILAVDRILDMMRTSTNVMSDLTCTAVIAKSEGEELSAAIKKA